MVVPCYIKSISNHTVEKVLRGGANIAVPKVCAEVCLRCKERLYLQEIVRRFEKIRAKLIQEKSYSTVITYALRGSKALARACRLWAGPSGVAALLSGRA